MNAKIDTVTLGAGLTRKIAERLVARDFRELPDGIIRLAKHSFLDWLGVTLAGAEDPAPSMLAAELIESGGNPEACLIGRNGSLPILSAALINGTASHALDYDDVNLPMSTHPGVVIWPALMALAEKTQATGQEVIEAFVLGYEAATQVGQLVSPAHYQIGFHGTATIGTFAAMAACSRLMKLDADQMEMAFGIAATQAAGVRAMFGTDCKPLHAGKANYNGLLAALMARRGFTSKAGSLECDVGFAQTHSADFSPASSLATPPNGYWLTQNLFKYHAACYMTHSVADGIAQLMEKHGLTNDDIKSVDVTLETDLNSVCNIQRPNSGLELKFSARAVAAMTLIGIDTGKMASYDGSLVGTEPFESALAKVTIKLDGPLPQTRSEVLITTTVGKTQMISHDAGVPDADLDRQEKRLIGKFIGLTEGMYSQSPADVVAQILTLETTPNASAVLSQLQF